jgi:acetolactate synthase-1/3 small subunit
MRFVIAVYVENTYGVLARVSGLFMRRGYNIDSLTVGETDDPNFSRITITLDGDDHLCEQIINQLYKLHNVKKVEVLDGECIKRQLMLLKVSYNSQTRAEILAAAEIYRGNVIDYTPDEMCIEVTGHPKKIDAFIKLMIPFGILEMCRTGVVALERGTKTLFND